MQAIDGIIMPFVPYLHPEEDEGLPQQQQQQQQYGIIMTSLEISVRPGDRNL